MGVVWPQDVTKMLLKQARTVSWKKWAAKHECQELKQGVRLEPIQALLRSKTNEVFWTDKHRHVMRKFVVEGRWVQNRLYDIGCADLYRRKSTEKHMWTHCPSWRKVREAAPRRAWSMGAEGQDFERTLDVAPTERRQLEEKPNDFRGALSLWAPSKTRNGPLWEFWRPSSKKWPPKCAFLPWSVPPFRGRRTNESLIIRKTFKTPNESTKHACCLKHVLS